jgi:hypothetical protein
MKCLRLFLQHFVRRWLQERQWVSPADCSDILPAAAISKLSVGSASLSSIVAINSFVNIFTRTEEDVEDISMPLRLYQDSLLSFFG